MKRLVLCVLISVASTVAVTSAHAIAIRDDISDSDYVVDDADFPALVDLFEPGDCIGTLIQQSLLLTVAHCATELTAGQSLNVNGVDKKVAEVILHPSWRDEEDDFDIAVVRFETPVAGVVPLPIYRGSLEVSAQVTLVGRGVTATGPQGEEGAASDGKLRRATNTVTAANDHFFEIVFERGGEAGVTSLEGVGCPAIAVVQSFSRSRESPASQD